MKELFQSNDPLYNIEKGVTTHLLDMEKLQKRCINFTIRGAWLVLPEM